MVSIIIVNWNSGPLLEKCVRSLLDNSAGSQIVVVDNASTDSSLRFSAVANVSLIRNNRNAGFAAGCNMGWRSASGTHVLFLNPDVEALPESIAVLEETLTRDSSIWAAGGRLVNPSGLSGNYVRDFPTVWRVAMDALLIDEVLPAGRRRSHILGGSEAPIEADQPGAACLMLSRRALDATGGFDEAFYPAWFEDVDLCRRIRNRGGRILYQPAARFLHHGGYSLERMSRQAFLEFFHTNQIRYFRKHHGRRAALAVKGLIICGLLLRTAISLVYPLAPDSSRMVSARIFRNALRGLLQPRGGHV